MPQSKRDRWIWLIRLLPTRIRRLPGYDGVDLEAAKEKGIMVLYAPRANSESVAELAVFYMLYCSRNFKLVQKLYKDDYRFAKFNIEKHELCGKTLGLVGVGNIGGLVARKAALGFDMKVLAFDPYAKELPGRPQG